MDPAKEEPNLHITGTAPLIMVAGGEGLLSLDKEKLNLLEARVLYNGLPSNPEGASFDPHTPLADPKELDFLADLKHKLCFSQHEPPYLEAFYSGYQNRGIQCLYLPYAADLTQMGLWEFKENPDYDLVFVGNLAHRKKGNLEPLKAIFAGLDPKRVAIYGDQEWEKEFGIKTSLLSGDVDWAGLYQNAAIALNLHSYRQKRRMIQVNDRCFHIPLYGGFELCDHPLAGKFFGPDEMAIAAAPGHLVELFFYFLKNPTERQEQIERARARVANDHSYFSRIAALWSALGFKEKVIWEGVEYTEPVFEAGPARPIGAKALLLAKAETWVYQKGRVVRSHLKKGQTRQPS
ncbi:MAG: hypothetical protein A2527_09260 [Candidatus Lambdaproteobacteria bacterium RIFOXYD2_FULL_50_16]|uniref:Spore protein YkvP/CgeB glycosyl transferase-like domain-containing protein n=1 Tax=Candidatus Lambdaproteobacteria bacterium RIFOXYD2_FULL_50_16 TaxID=1817772 RepID=A0A1F6G7F8_9PROT|nr:MAG: hypothetical protein A2527_09260 [Candidatus Lambdaproteobacteria bacterium RIFOXYD2_FULL_50_16]